jgi:hypothetical protein
MNKKAKIMAYLRTKGYDLRKIKGCDLNNPEIISRGLLKDEALAFVNYLQKLQIPIFGGDVYYIDDNSDIRLTYDNWYCDKIPEENNIEYCMRSIKITMDYINKYQSYQNYNLLFDVVYPKLDNNE